MVAHENLVKVMALSNHQLLFSSFQKLIKTSQYAFKYEKDGRTR